MHYIPTLPGGKLILSPTGPCNRDFDDVRVFAGFFEFECISVSVVGAARAGVLRSLKAGCLAPLLYIPARSKTFENNLEVAILAAYQELYPVCDRTGF